MFEYPCTASSRGNLYPYDDPLNSSTPTFPTTFSQTLLHLIKTTNSFILLTSLWKHYPSYAHLSFPTCLFSRHVFFSTPFTHFSPSAPCLFVSINSNHYTYLEFFLVIVPEQTHPLIIFIRTLFATIFCTFRYSLLSPTTIPRYSPCVWL